jgi:hypothetical protein
MFIPIIISIISIIAGIILLVKSLKIQNIIMKVYKHNQENIISVYDYNNNLFNKANIIQIYRSMRSNKTEEPQNILKKISRFTNSEIVLILKKNKNNYEVKSNWYYPKKINLMSIKIHTKSKFIEKLNKEKALTIDALLKEKIPKEFRDQGITSLIAVKIDSINIFTICNSLKIHGKKPFQVNYTSADMKIAEIIASIM